MEQTRPFLQERSPVLFEHNLDFGPVPRSFFCKGLCDTILVTKLQEEQQLHPWTRDFCGGHKKDHAHLSLDCMPCVIDSTSSSLFSKKWLFPLLSQDSFAQCLAVSPQESSSCCISFHFTMLPPLLCNKKFKWAINTSTNSYFCFQCLSFCLQSAVVKQIKMIHSIPPDHDTSFKRETIPNWLPDSNPMQVHVHSFQNPVKSPFANNCFFKESNLSLPNIMTPHCFKNIPSVSVTSELHHGSWWRETVGRNTAPQTRKCWSQ